MSKIVTRCKPESKVSLDKLRDIIHQETLGLFNFDDEESTEDDDFFDDEEENSSVNFECTGTIVEKKPYCDYSYRNVVIKLSGFRQNDDNTITFPDGQTVDEETFIAKMKVHATKRLDSKYSKGFEKDESITHRIVTSKFSDWALYSQVVNSKGDIYIDIDLSTPVITNHTFDNYNGVENSPNEDDFIFRWGNGNVSKSKRRLKHR